jgi:hypothetical protein
MLTKLIERCVPCSRRQEVADLSQQREELVTRTDGVSEDEIHFIIPVADFPRFEERKPAEGVQLNIGHFMFLYRYNTTKENFKRPGPDHEWVMYFFRDRRSIYLIKGWVPTKLSYLNYISQKSSVFTGVKRNARFQKLNQFAKSSTSESSNSIYSDGCLQEQLVPGDRLPTPSASVCSLLPKSAYTGDCGAINSWSRHVKPGNAEYTRSGLGTTNPYVHSSASMDQLTKEIFAVIEGQPLDKGYVRGGDPRWMVKSTIDTRDRRYRPGAAKGPRTRPVMREKYML